MKFTKEEAFESLKGILTNGGKKPLRMSERSLREQSDDLIDLVANEEMELEDFVGKVKKLLSSTNSNVEKDSSDRFKEHVKQWEKEHPVENPEPVKNDDPKPDDAMAKLLKRIDELEQKEAQREKERSISDKRSQLLRVMKEKGIKDEQWSKDFVSEISITEDFDIEAKADLFLKLYNKSKASSANGNNCATPKDASASGNNSEAHRFDYLKKDFEREQERSKNVI